MKILFILIPILAVIAALILNSHHGKKEILRFDSVQFFYAFVLMPVLYVWCKSFLFSVLQTQFPLLISQSAVVFWDAIYSVLFLFVYAFTVIHTLTKSFKLKREKDPLYDLLEHSEYFHLWVSHTAIYGGIMLLFTLFSAMNIWLDLPWVMSQLQFYSLLVLSALFSGLIFQVFLSTDLDKGKGRFARLMKLLSAVFFVIHVGMYAFFEPVFAGEKAMFWSQLTVFLSLSCISLFYPEPEKPSFQQRVRRRLQGLFRWLKN